jgi:hypothetical protein
VSNSDKLQVPEKETTTKGLNRTHQADSMVISEYKNLKKYLVVRRKKRSILQDSGKGAAHREQSETRNIRKLCVVLFHR